jgi:hypothetical protein
MTAFRIRGMDYPTAEIPVIAGVQLFTRRIAGAWRKNG